MFFQMVFELTARKGLYYANGSARLLVDIYGGALKPHRFFLQNRDNFPVGVSNQVALYQGFDADGLKSPRWVKSLAP